MRLVALGELGPRSAPAVLKLAERLTDYLNSEPMIGGANPPWMVAGYGMGAGSDLRVEIIQTLVKIGPAAKPALPVLRDFVSVGIAIDTGGVRQLAAEAIAQIEGTPEGDDR